jgi:RNA polymerase sigma-70 factor, ECF subfamily
MNTCGERQLCRSDCDDTSSKRWESGVSRTEMPRDLAGFKHIYQLHNRNIYSFCLGMVGNRAEAENLMKEAFLNVFRQADTRHSDETLATSLYRFVITALRMQFRNDQPGFDTSLPTGTSLGSQNCDLRAVKRVPSAVSESAIDRRHLQQAIVQLPLDLRIVFILHDVLGCEHSKVAEILEFSPHTARSQLHKARLRLRECLWGRTKRPEGETRFTKPRA